MKLNIKEKRVHLEGARKGKKDRCNRVEEVGQIDREEVNQIDLDDVDLTNLEVWLICRQGI